MASDASFNNFSLQQQQPLQQQHHQQQQHILQEQQQNQYYSAGQQYYPPHPSQQQYIDPYTQPQQQQQQQQYLNNQQQLPLLPSDHEGNLRPQFPLPNLHNATPYVSELAIKISECCPQPPFAKMDMFNLDSLNETEDEAGKDTGDLVMKTENMDDSNILDGPNESETQSNDSNIPVSPSNKKIPMKRGKRRSKFTKEQDDMILKLKKKGKSWNEIAKYANIGTSLAARNRYQVLIGQQGGGHSEFEKEDCIGLQKIVDSGEFEKFKFLSKEFEKITGKLYSLRQLREFIRYLFWLDPGIFEVDENYVNELMNLHNNS